MCLDMRECKTWGLFSVRQWQCSPLLCLRWSDSELSLCLSTELHKHSFPYKRMWIKHSGQGDRSLSCHPRFPTTNIPLARQSSVPIVPTKNGVAKPLPYKNIHQFLRIDGYHFSFLFSFLSYLNETATDCSVAVSFICRPSGPSFSCCGQGCAFSVAGSWG